MSQLAESTTSVNSQAFRHVENPESWCPSARLGLGIRVDQFVICFGIYGTTFLYFVRLTWQFESLSIFTQACDYTTYLQRHLRHVNSAKHVIAQFNPEDIQGMIC